MAKSLHTRHQKVLIDLLKQIRRESGINQIKLAELLRRSQSFVAKCETGERRLEILELREWCEALDVSLFEFVERLESAISRKRGPKDRK